MTTAENAGAARRPLKSRGTKWANAAAQWLARAGVRPNSISLLSLVFAAGAGAALLFVSQSSSIPRALLFLAAAAGIQLRLLCNLLDGMVAIEGGKKSKSGEIYNDLPDRIADPLILVPAGYAATWIAWGPELGWLAGLLALMTAYIRVLGGSTGIPQNFMGPMAKQHRMAVMTASCLLSMFESFLGWRGVVITVGLGVIIVGSAMTAVRRVRRLVRELEAR